jgi:hypothetical protein
VAHVLLKLTGKPEGNRMRKGHLLAVVVSAILVGGIAIFAWQRQSGRLPTPIVASIPGNFPREAENVLDPPVELLLHESAKNDRDRKSRFFATLLALAQKHGLTPKDYCLEGTFAAVDEGYGIQVGPKHDRHVILVLRGDSHTIPGFDTQFLLLLDRDGRPLDRLSCEISNRLTRFFVGYEKDFRTEVLDGHEEDGAQLVIRHIPSDDKGWGQCQEQTITHGSQSMRYFRWHPGCLLDVRDSTDWVEWGICRVCSTVWDNSGLCRMAVRDGQFTVLFPQPEE